MELVSEIPRVCQNAVKKMLKNGVFWAEWEQVRVQVGPKLGASRVQVGCKCPRRACAKWGDLRAYLGSVEGLYPLEGEVRNTGVSEGFTGKAGMRFISNGGLLSPYGGSVPKKFAEKFFGKKIESPAFPNARLSVKVFSELSPIRAWGL